MRLQIKRQYFLNATFPLVRRFASFIEFEIDKQTARSTFETSIKQHYLGPGTAQTEEFAIQPKYQPYWLFDAKISYLARAQIGTREFQLKYNPRLRRYQTGWTTIWKQSPWIELTANMKKSDKEMQVNSSLKVPNDLLLWNLEKFLPKSKPLNVNFSRKNSLFEKFDMPENVAWSQAVEAVTAGTLTQQIKFALKEIYGSSSIREIQIRIISQSFSSHKLYFPVYFINYSHQSNPFLVAVNGVNADVSGTLLFSPEKSSVLFLFLWTAGVFPLAPAVLTTSLGLFFTSVVTGGVFLLARWYAPLMERYRSTKHSADVAKLLAMGAGPGAGEYEENTRNGGFGFRQRRQGPSFSDFTEEILRAFRQQSGFSERFTSQGFQFRWETGGQRETSHEKREHENFQQRYAREQVRRKDAKGYYKILGVSPSAPPDEIKTAYRKLALETHPDRQTDPLKRAEAEEKFKAISEANRVLSNEEDRRKYDSGIHV